MTGDDFKDKARATGLPVWPRANTGWQRDTREIWPISSGARDCYQHCHSKVLHAMADSDQARPCASINKSRTIADESASPLLNRLSCPDDLEDRHDSCWRGPVGARGLP